MKRTFILLLGVLILHTATAQRITRTYHNTPMPQVLKELNSLQHQYIINFVYDELEDFRVSGSIKGESVPVAIRRLIGVYPIVVKEEQPDILLVECLQKESRRVTGRVVDESGRPVEYANVALLDVADSAFVNGGVTTVDGNFVIPASRHNLIVKVSYVGYTTVTRRLAGYNAGTISLRPDAYQLKRVDVMGRRKTTHVDHDVYTFNDEQLKKSRQVQELITTLPDLRIDPNSGKVATLSGKSLLILINGIEVNDNQLKTISPDKVKNVDYYTIPPARYASYGTVINIHTRKLDTGYATGFDVTQGLGGFNNTNVYAQYNKGNSQLSFDYTLQYRNAGDCNAQDTYKMTRDDTPMTYEYDDKYHFGYADQDFNLRYLYSLGDSLNFQVKFTPNLFRWFWRDKYDIKALGNPLWTNGRSRQEKLQKSFGPSLDLYFDHIFAHNQQLMFDLVGTWYHNKQNNDNHQWDEAYTDLLNDHMRQRSNKYSLIGEAAYTKTWEKAKLSLGYKATLAKSNYKLSNVLSNYNEFKSHARNDNHYAYAQLGGHWGKMEYRLSLGGTYVHTSNEATTYNKLYFTPQALLAYPVKNGQLRLVWSSSPDLPEISQLSDNSTVVIPGLINRGNPLLKSGLTNESYFSYSVSSPYIDLNASGGISHTRHSISNYYLWQHWQGEDVVLSQPMNNDYDLSLSAQTRIELKPFKSELLVVALTTGFVHQKQKSDFIGTHQNNYWPLRLLCSFDYKGWGGFFYWNRQTMQLDGSYLSSDENTANIQLYWKHKQLQLSVGCLFPFEAPHYKSYTLSNNILEIRRYNEIPSQRGQIFLGLSWNIFSGKQKKLSKKIENGDYDKGMF